MHEILSYILCLTSLVLIILCLINFKRNTVLEKIIYIIENINKDQLKISDLGNSFNLIFLDAESEQMFLGNVQTYKSKNKSIIFYRAPEYRIKLFEKKIPENMVVCLDNELSKIFNIKEYPCFFELNYSKKMMKKIY